jgi:4'-phosphopantetheinyl transferase
MTDKDAVYWFAATAGEVPGGVEWLTGRERDKLEQLSFTKRRADWRLGRWTAKRAVCSLAGRTGRILGATDVEIVAAADGAPELLMQGVQSDSVLSISHCRDVGCVVLSPDGSAVGCDVEAVEPRSDLFLSDYFTDDELRLVGREARRFRPLLANLIWSAKESVLKSMRKGMNRDTRSVEVRLPAKKLDSGDDWSAFTASCSLNSAEFGGWWRRAGEFVYTVACPAGTKPPVALD